MEAVGAGGKEGVRLAAVDSMSPAKKLGSRAPGLGSQSTLPLISC